MEFGVTTLYALCRSAFFDIEVILPSWARQKLACFGYLETLGIGLIGFHAHSEPYILLIFSIM